MPHGSELMYLPDRRPILFNQNSGIIEALSENPYAPGEPIFAVAAFNSPGYVITHVSAYRERQNANYLPLFCYGAVGWHRGKFRTAVVRVDAEPRQDLRQMQRDDVVAGIKKARRQMPQNRLRSHLETCALEYGCPCPPHKNAMPAVWAACHFRKVLRFHAVKTALVLRRLLMKFQKWRWPTFEA